MRAAQYNHAEATAFAIHNATLYPDRRNNRLKILGDPFLSDPAMKSILNYARTQDFGKLLSNCRLKNLSPYLCSGFVLEGIIDGFYSGEPAYCVSRFLDRERVLSEHRREENKIVSRCLSDRKAFEPQRKHGCLLRPAEERDIPQMIALFSSVFETYPSPVYDPDYLRGAMNGRVMFKVAETAGKIVSVASADLDPTNRNAEITDCATDPRYRGRGLLQHLISGLCANLSAGGYRIAFSLARAKNPGVNLAFSRMGFRYGGRLIQNCDICGGYEDMNIWSKLLQEPA